MTEQETLEYNKRCAEFLGWKETTEQFKIDWVGCKTKERLDRLNKQYIPILEKNGDVLFPDFNVINFHEDWNWIMEVVDAIEKLGYQFDITGNEVGVNSNIMTMENISTGGTMNSYNRSYYPTIISICEEEYSKKEAVVQAINQFLIWYNNEKSN